MNIVIRASKGMPADSRHICLGQAAVLDVLGAAPRQIAFQTRQTSGNRLLVSLAEAVPLDTAVQIVRDGALLLGEVTGCWQDSPGTVLAVVEFSQYLARA
jgi:hypothetical protein